MIPLIKVQEQAKIIYGDRNQKIAAREGQMGESGLAEKGREWSFWGDGHIWCHLLVVSGVYAIVTTHKTEYLRFVCIFLYLYYTLIQIKWKLNKFQCNLPKLSDHWHLWTALNYQHVKNSSVSETRAASWHFIYCFDLLKFCPATHFVLCLFLLAS